MPGIDKQSTRQVVMLLASVVIISLYMAISASFGRSAQRPNDDDALFRKNCARCHGNDGRGRTLKAKFNHARDLTDPKWQAAVTDEHMYESILHGKEKMPAFSKKISELEVAALVTYVRVLKRHDVP